MYHTAYEVNTLSSLQEWKNAYIQDSKIADIYAGKSWAEDVAQNTIVAAHDLLVPDGGLAKFSGNLDWSSDYHQYELVRKRQGDAVDVLLPDNCFRFLKHRQKTSCASRHLKFVMLTLRYS